MMLVSLLACQPDYGVYEQSRELYVQPLADAGGVTVGERLTVRVPLYSVGRGRLTVDNIGILNQQDEEAFVLLPSWANADLDDDGSDDYLEFETGASDGTIFEEIEINFRPETEGYFRATVYVDTNDNRVVPIDPIDGLHDGGGVHVFQVRGLARYPSSSYYPPFIDFGQRAVGGAFFETASIVNTGSVILTVAGFDFSSGSSASYYVSTPSPVYILPGDTEEIEIGYIPGKDSKERAEITLVTSDPDQEPLITVIGNSCEDSLHESWDKDGDGYYACGLDCDDNLATVYPDAQESNNGRDDDCDGLTDEGADLVSNDDDGDGYSENEGDCFDDDATVSPDADEIANDFIDNDCDGEVDEGGNRADDDGDGYSNREGDCEDRDATIGPEADEVADEIDNDCDGHIDEGTWAFDDDQDGATESEGDCDDYDAWTYPGAVEDCDGIDNDCDNVVDESDDGGDACSYLAEALVVEPPDKGCASTRGTADGALGILVLLGMLGLRRRRD
ncbi:MAG TPA: MopE-related protein [Myxococcota bacterium]|nr:MopE-related protein [Myxococcota bacterium]